MSDIAERIADDLFQNGQGEKVERLTLELENGRYGGGWCRAAVVDRVDLHIKNLLAELERLAQENRDLRALDAERAAAMEAVERHIERIHEENIRLRMRLETNGVTP